MNAPPPNGSESGPSIDNLTAADFRLFEDGKEQKIQSVSLHRTLSFVIVHDSAGSHAEQSDTPGGKWRYAEIEPGWWTGKEFFSLIAYAPPVSAEGSCHKLQVKIDRPNSIVYARHEYCNIKHSSSDPLDGTKFGEQMQNDLMSDRPAKAPLSFQTGLFFAENNSARVSITVEFPSDRLKHEWRSEWGLLHIYATVGVLGIVCRRDGTVIARFSDLAPRLSDDAPNFIWGDPESLNLSQWDAVDIPTSYETQIDLPPGEYELRLALSDGTKFGRAVAPLIIEDYDRKQLGISSVLLCRGFRDVRNPPKLDDGTVVSLAPELEPLISNGMVFSPAGGTFFNKRDPMFAYFEIYEPLLLTGTPVLHTQLKITNVKTGEVSVDTGWRNAADWIQPGKSVVRIAEQIAIDKLPRGPYKLEVQATDSAGRSTAWRAASFTIE